MRTSYDIINTLIRTEKGANLLEPKGKYVFEVAVNANKIQIKKAVEEIYNVKVATVNTLVAPGKSKRVRQEYGMTPAWKKAVVTLKAGNTINIT